MRTPSAALANESGRPVRFVSCPFQSDGGDDSDDDPLSSLRKDIRDAKGRALLVETSAAGWGEGRAAAPQADWQAKKIRTVADRCHGRARPR